MSDYIIHLVRTEKIADGTMAYYFQRPEGFTFKPGQSADLTLVDPPETDAEGNIRTFSFAGAPSDPYLLFATRNRNTAFKRVLASAPAGFPVQMAGPMGSFTLHKNLSKPAVLLAGGIGITPFHSMIASAAAGAEHPLLWLFYSNRDVEGMAFYDELNRLVKSVESFHFVPSLSGDSVPVGWTGERGNISPELLRRHLPDLSGPIYYVAGPPAMVSAIREILTAAGVDEDDVRAEDFAGY